MGNNTPKSKKVVRTGTLALKEAQSIFRRINTFGNWKAGIFVRLLMEEHGQTARGLERKTGFSHAHIIDLANTFNFEEDK